MVKKNQVVDRAQDERTGPGVVSVEEKSMVIIITNINRGDLYINPHHLLPDWSLLKMSHDSMRLHVLNVLMLSNPGTNI